MSQLPSQPSSLQPGLQPPFSEFVVSAASYDTLWTVIAAYLSWEEAARFKLVQCFFLLLFIYYTFISIFPRSKKGLNHLYPHPPPNPPPQPDLQPYFPHAFDSVDVIPWFSYTDPPAWELNTVFEEQWFSFCKLVFGIGCTLVLKFHQLYNTIIYMNAHKTHSS